MTAPRVVGWFALGLGVLALLAGLYLSVCFLPYPLFRHHMAAASFSVDSDRQIPENFRLVLADVRRRVDARHHRRPLDVAIPSPPDYWWCCSKYRSAGPQLAAKRGSRPRGSGKRPLTSSSRVVVPS